MSTGWTAPGADSGHSSPEPGGAREGFAAPSAAPAVPPSASGPRGSGRPLQRELVQQVPLFPLRPLSVGEVLGAAVRIYRRRAKPILMLSAAVHGIAYVLITGLTGASMVPLIGETRAILEDPQASTTTTFSYGSLSQSLSMLAGSLITGVISLVAAAMVTAVLTRVAIGEATGEPVPASEMWPELRRLALPSVLVSVLVSALVTAATVTPIALGVVPLLIWQEATVFTVATVVLGLLISIAMGIWLYARTLLAIPALVIERTGVVAAVRRSFALTRGRRIWRVLGLGVLLALLYYVAVQVLSGVFGMVGMVAYVAILLASNLEGIVVGVTILTILTMIGAYVATFLLAPYLSAGTAAIYADNRMRHEAWDIELNRAARDAWEEEPRA